MVKGHAFSVCWSRDKFRHILLLTDLGKKSAIPKDNFFLNGDDDDVDDDDDDDDDDDGFLCKLNLLIHKCTSIPPTRTLSTVSGKTGWTGSTCVSSSISWRRQVNAFNTCVTRLTTHLAGIKVTIAEPSWVTVLTCARWIHKFAVSVEYVTFLWWDTLTTMLAGAHVYCRGPDGTCSFVISRYKRYINLKTKKTPSVTLANPEVWSKNKAGTPPLDPPLFLIMSINERAGH